MIFYSIFQFKNEKICNYCSNEQYFSKSLSNNKNIIKLAKNSIIIRHKSKVFAKTDWLFSSITSLSIKFEFFSILRDKSFFGANQNALCKSKNRILFAYVIIPKNNKS